LAPFQWLDMSEDEGGGPLGVIFTVAFFRGLDPAEVIRRFSCGEDSGQQADIGGLDEKAYEFVTETAGGDGGGHVGVFQSGEWCVAIEPYGWMATLHEVATKLSRDCEMLAVTRHDYAAEHHFTYAIDGTIVTAYRLRHPYERYGSGPDRLNGFMLELGMGVPVAIAENPTDLRLSCGYSSSQDRLAGLHSASYGGVRPHRQRPERAPGDVENAHEGARATEPRRSEGR
jgi:hypothetical protein